MKLIDSEIEFELLRKCWQCDGGNRDIDEHEQDYNGKCNVCHGRYKILTEDGEKIAELLEFLKS